MKAALILVDLQNDFCPLGALPVAEGDAVVPLANELMPLFEAVVASQDWHPANHGSFAANHPWRKPGQVIDLHGLPQVLWTIHCVQHSFGAELVAELDAQRITAIFQKGTDPTVDSYSAFFDNGKRHSTGMGEWLAKQQVDTLFIMGLATDYCVKYTTLHALELGFTTYLVQDACRGVNLQPGDSEAAVAEMQAAGAIIVNAEDVAKILHP